MGKSARHGLPMDMQDVTCFSHFVLDQISGTVVLLCDMYHRLCATL